MDIIKFVLPLLYKVPFLGSYIEKCDFSEAKTFQDYVNILLAVIITDLKAKDPYTWSIISLVITAIFVTFTKGVDIGIIHIDPNSIWSKIISVIAFIAALFNQSKSTVIASNNTNVPIDEKSEDK